MMKFFNFYLPSNRIILNRLTCRCINYECECGIFQCAGGVCANHGSVADADKVMSTRQSCPGTSY